MNQTTTLQKESIPSISHCFVLERVEEWYLYMPF
jgi:hypothetical protein